MRAFVVRADFRGFLNYPSKIMSIGMATSGVARKTGELMRDVSEGGGLLKLTDNAGIRTNS